MFRDYECTNCNEYGHGYSHCPQPIVSYGIILYDNIRKRYLMIRRKDSFGFIDFVKGKYSLSDLYHIKNSIAQMSNDEKDIILKNVNNFDKLWYTLNDVASSKKNNYFYNSQKKFENLKKGISFNGEIYTLEGLIRSCESNWNETEWEFPKGRKLKGESDVNCALREFEEETGLGIGSIQLLENVVPFEEIFIGSNHRSYKHKYFVAVKNDDGDYTVTKFQKSEVSKIEWKTFEESLSIIRNYHIEKKQVLFRVNYMLNNFALK
jgi:8-oxo-dGTP pyrophosphatase MutT (NUDIX family)